jgi:hypothetical protein
MALMASARGHERGRNAAGPHDDLSRGEQFSVERIIMVGTLSRVRPSARQLPAWVRWASVPAVVLTVALGIWIAGGLITDDANLAMGLTTGWLALSGALAILAALRWRTLALLVLPAYAASAFGLGGYLLVTSSVDRVVNEQVTVAGDVPPTDEPVGRPTAAAENPEPVASPPTAAPPTPVQTRILAAGEFTSGAHETRGVATVLQRPDGSRVLTLTGVATDPGPDLRVYLVAGDGSDVSGAIDVGGLKGNKGNQEYDVPGSAPSGAVVIWCRAFSVEFGTAALA